MASTRPGEENRNEEKTPASSAAGKNRALAFLKLGLKLGFTALLLWLLYRKMDLQAFRSSLQELRWELLPLFYAIAVGNMWISSVRWKLFLRADGVEISTSLLFRSHWISSFFNFFLPSNIGGDVYRMADIGRRSGRPVGSVASVFADRLAGFVAMSFLGFLFPLLGYSLIPPEKRMLLLVPAVLFFGFLTAAFLLLQQRLLLCFLRFFPQRVREPLMRFATRFFESIHAYARTPAVFLKAVLLSIVFQFFVIVAVYVVGASLRIPVSFAPYCVFVPFVCLLESVPLSLNGMGLRDTGYLFFFEAVGLATAASTSAALSLCYVTLTLFYALGGGLLFLFRQFLRRV